MVATAGSRHLPLVPAVRRDREVWPGRLLVHVPPRCSHPPSRKETTMKTEILAAAVGMITQVAHPRAESGPADAIGPAGPGNAAARPAIVLVHGGFVDGSGWQAVYQQLRRDGYVVRVVQNPTTSLSDDVAETRRVIASLEGPVVLVGHSYGG